MAKNSLEELASYLTRKQKAPVKLTGSTTSTGRTDRDTRVTGLPMPLGDEGEVLTIVDDAGDLVPSWEPSVAANGQYQLYVVIDDGDDGYHIMDNGAGDPLYLLADLE